MLTKILEKLESHDDKFEALLESSKSMDSRVGTLEQAHWKQMGIVTTVSIAASAAWGFFTGK